MTGRLKGPLIADLQQEIGFECRVESNRFWGAMILHVDMDAFYASVEERDQPALVGKPIVVGGSPGRRGVVAAANYVARRFGIHSAMPAATAQRLCPHAVFLRPRMDHYAEISAQIRAVFDEYTPLVEPLSLDEAFLDVTGSELLHGSAIAMGRQIKRDIRDRLSLVASVGVAPNKFLAKIASDLNKPDGFVVVDPDRIQEFLDPLPIGRLWGVGRVTRKAFEKLGVFNIEQLRRMSADVLRGQFGSHGDHLWKLAHGIDDRRVVPEQDAKSISHEKTFVRDLEGTEVVRAWLQELSEQVACRLRRHQVKGKTVNLKVRFEDFHTVTRSHTLPAPTDATEEIWQTVATMFQQRMPARRMTVRLLGVGVSGLSQRESSQQVLFPDAARNRQTSLDQVADNIKKKFGASSLRRGFGLLHNTQPRPDADQPNPDQYGE